MSFPVIHSRCYGKISGQSLKVMCIWCTEEIFFPDRFIGLHNFNRLLVVAGSSIPFVHCTRVHMIEDR